MTIELLLVLLVWLVTVMIAFVMGATGGIRFGTLRAARMFVALTRKHGISGGPTDADLANWTAFQAWCKS